MDKQEVLREWGLSSNEVETYLFLLERGSSPIQDVAKGTGILRQTLYEIMTKLEHQGLISEVKQNKKTYFKAANPNRLISQLKEKEKSVLSILPELNDLLNQGKTNSEAQLFRGLKGLRTINEEVLKSKSILTILPLIGEESLRDFYVENFSKKRIAKKIPIKIIRGKVESEVQKKIKTDTKAFREVRLLEKLKEIQTQYIIFEDSLAVISYHQDPFGVIIKDNLVVESMRSIFNILWDISKRY